MDVGVVLPVEGDRASPALIAAVAREAESLGFHSVWTTDRLATPKHPPRDYPYSAERGAIAFRNDRNWLDPIAVMGMVAGLTTTVRIGTNVLVVPYRHAMILAQEIASLDFLSGGRILLGIGAGWMSEEFEALGLKRSERGPRTDEHIRAMRDLWSAPGPTSFHGAHTHFDDMALAAKSGRPTGPPVLVGGNSAAALARTARLGDGWAGVDMSPAEAAGTVRKLAELYENEGRSIDDQIISLKRRLEPAASDHGTDPAARMLGSSAPALTDELGRYADAGITLLVYDLMNVPDIMSAIRLIAADVLPHVPGGARSPATASGSQQ